ncbi:MAG: DUF4236 domain-containing protein [Acidobacteriota bacterium]|nr:DUF4236 domain-containing protein [Acidobacteriota bacterium]
MGWRFRKSAKIFPGIRLNFGKNGFTSTTFGKGWFSSNVSKRGVKHTLSIPGTGISYQTKTTRTGSLAKNTPLYKPTETCWTCSKCAMINLPESANCEICNRENPRIRTNAMIAAGQIYWYCKKCYTANLPDSRYCEKCGGDYCPNPQQIRTNPQPIRKNYLTKGQWYIVGGLVSVVLFLAGVSGLVEQPENKNTQVTASPTATVNTISTFENIVPSKPVKTESIKPNQLKTMPMKTAPLLKESKAESYITPSKADSGYYTGPRGGCYTYTSGGKKRYVDRSLCH